MITTEQVLNWLGEDWEKESIAYMFSQIANGEYDPKVLKSDIEQYDE